MKARANGILPLTTVEDFVGTVATRLRKREFRTFASQRVLYFHGLPWRGELWLDDHIRLGPPSKQFHEGLVNGSRVINVDFSLEAATNQHARDLIDAKNREIGIFLSVVIGGLFQPNRCSPGHRSIAPRRGDPFQVRLAYSLAPQELHRI